MSDIHEFVLGIAWRSPTRPESMSVFAKDEEEAKKIAVVLFRRTHTPECEIVQIDLMSVNSLT